jgi:hypothetical protein
VAEGEQIAYAFGQFFLDDKVALPTPAHVALSEDVSPQGQRVRHASKKSPAKVLTELKQGG